ncbi:hypothetical protein D8674_020311 [Pyrus ussuriensis x Pyrus communis]|uniref:Uncharacterized protein n=1 Tax=Pyrus ussuriensis x Pyrus communis TaxID=2448454 RepID=A0A5N5HJD3_9ROSA|nr:hypothetical protein D8674_020311 [Pyrus ussuriensis x Pyrus communis]
MKPVNDNAFIDQFTSLWRRREGVSIKALGGAHFMARFVGWRDTCRVLKAGKPWLFMDDMVLVVDGVQHGHWANPLHLVMMWVQMHNIPPLNIMDVVARAIGGLLETVVKVDKDVRKDCIGLFGPGGIIAPSAGMIELVSHLEEFKGNEEHTEVVQQSIDIDLNMSIMEGVEEGSVRAPKGYGVDGGVEQRLLSQDSDPFNLLPIIEAISRKGRKGLERMMKMICVWQKMDWIVCIRYKGLLGMSCMHAIEPMGFADGMCLLMTRITCYPEPCLLIGDFNDLLLDSEKDGGKWKNCCEHEGFLNFCGSSEFDEGCIQERLDRALATHNWLQSYQQAVMKHVVLKGSDQCYCKKQFMYYPRWNHDPKCDEMGRNEQKEICRFKEVIRDVYQQPVFDVFFCQATEIEALNVKGLLQQYAEGSGQFINLDKSSVHFSVGCLQGLKAHLSQILGIKHQEGFGKYLGIHTNFGALKKRVFEELLQDFGGRDQKTKKGIHWMAWNKVAKKKDSSGLGFKEIIDFNLAMLAKVGWRLICNLDSLLARILQAKYDPSLSFMDAPVGRNTSWGWKGILQGRKILKAGVRWWVEDGRCIQIATDPWLPIPRTFRSNSCHQEMPTLVADLVDMGGKWKREVIELLEMGNSDGNVWVSLVWQIIGIHLVFEKVAVEPFVAIQLLKQQWKEMKVCEEAQVLLLPRGQQMSRKGLQGWIKPPFGTFKINYDGAWDFVGIFKDVGGVGKIPCVSSIMAEAEVMRLETDYQVLVDMIHGWLQPEAVLDGILWDISLLKQQFDVIEFLYAPRAYNEAAHLVVSYVTRVGGSHSWDGFEPKWLFNTLASDVNISIRI